MMNWHLSDMHWMHHSDGHTMHLHPAQWFSDHPIILALVIAGLVTVAVVGLARLSSGESRIDTLDRGFDMPAMNPYGGAY